jgi:DNA-repair protein XRCC1
MFPAKNLLSSSTNKKWKCGNLDTSSNFVILKLAKHTKIASINLGNQGSAFIEVLVADSREFGAEFKELILATTFMTQSDSMLQRNLNTVKCFPSNALVDEIKDKEWDRVKIVCKQPFNKTLKYGIAFINLQSPAPPKPRKSETDDEKSPIKNNQNNEEKKSSKSSEKVKKFGRFTMVMSSSDEEDEKTSTSFSRWKSSHFSDKKENSEKSLKRTIETKMSEDRNSKKFKKDDDKRKSSEKSKSSSSSSSRHRSKLMYESEDDEPNKKVEEKIKKDKSKEENSRFSHSSSSHSKSSTTTPKRVEEKTKLNFSSFIDDDEVDTKKENHRKSSSSRDHHKSSPKKPEKVETPKKPEKPEKLKKIEYKSFDKLFEGVTFAFSGYVNPERGILRNKAIEMGAKYQPDWNDRCTHLM